MTCSEFQNWLDEGMPGAADSKARAHADQCPECAVLLRASLAIEALLSERLSPAPMGFADRVMVRVSAADRLPAPAAVREPLLALPWWARAAADPAAVLAFIVAALFASRIDWLSAAGAFVARTTSRATALAPTAETAAWLGADRPPMQLALLLLGTSAIVWGSFALYRWTERITARRARASHAP